MTELEVLLGPSGRALLAELADADELGSLRLATSLRERFAPDLVAAALTQVELRRAARAKFTRADDMFFTRAGLEQSSSEAMSRHRATRFAGHARLADLCTGIGGDLISLAADHDVLAVDVDPVHLRMAVLNAEAYGVADRVTAVLGDVRSAELSD